MLERLGINVDIEDSSSNSNERFYLDRRLIVPVISSASYLLTEEKTSTNNLFLSIEYDNDQGDIIFEWTTLNSKPKLMRKSKVKHLSTSHATHFMTHF